MKKKIGIVLLLLMLISSIPVTASSNYKLTINLDTNRVKLYSSTILRGVALLDGAPVSNEDVTIKILASNGTIVYTDQVKPDGEGKFEFKISAIAPYYTKGDYTIYAKLGDVKESISFTVYTETTSSGSSGGSGGTTSNKTDDSTKKVSISQNGGTIKDSKQNVILTFEEGTFERRATVEVSLVNEKEIIEPQETHNLTRFTDVYEFTSSIKTFNKPVKAKFKYNNSKLNGINEELLGVYTLDEETNTWEYVGGKLDKNDNTIEAELKHFSKYTVMASTKTFDDITSHWANHEIKVMAARNIVHGMDGINYNPEGTITKAQFAKVLVCALGLEKDENYSQTFSDTANAWYTGYIETALKVGIISPIEESFYPNTPITREEMALMIVQALKYKDETKAVASHLIFEDIEELSETSKEAIAIAVENGIIKGMTSTTFAPKANATRAQAAVMIYRLLQTLDTI